jgi:hypothetical protein
MVVNTSQLERALGSGDKLVAEIEKTDRLPAAPLPRAARDLKAGRSSPATC